MTDPAPPRFHAFRLGFWLGALLGAVTGLLQGIALEAPETAATDLPKVTGMTPDLPAAQTGRAPL